MEGAGWPTTCIDEAKGPTDVTDIHCVLLERSLPLDTRWDPMAVEAMLEESRLRDSRGGSTDRCTLECSPQPARALPGTQRFDPMPLQAENTRRLLGPDGPMHHDPTPLDTPLSSAHESLGHPSDMGPIMETVRFEVATNTSATMDHVLETSGEGPSEPFVTTQRGSDTGSMSKGYISSSPSGFTAAVVTPLPQTLQATLKHV